MHEKILHITILHNGIEKFRTWITESDLRKFLLELKNNHYHSILFNKEIDLRIIEESKNNLVKYYYDSIRRIQIGDLIKRIKIQGKAKVSLEM